ncbi:MAG: EAL domain-containing protein [Gammaproteobacteria bacterium]
MSSEPLNDINFARYFQLLRQLMPRGMDFYVCSLSGAVLAADAGNMAPVAPSSVKVDRAMKQLSVGNESRLAADKGSDTITYVMDIHTSAGETAAVLVATGPVGGDPGATDLDHAVDVAFMSVVECIEKEYRLTVELNAMAQELAGRYEEINLMYDTSDANTSIEDEDITLKQLIENYVEYLDVDMVAIVYPQQERILCALGSRDPIPAPYEIIRRLSRDYLPQARAHGSCLLINDITDRRRDDLSLEMPYKILSCPVYNVRDEIDGILICLNHIYRADFYNSDRSLLKVMAKKVAKITQTNYDALTGLMNQLAFESVLQRALDQSRDEGVFHCLLNIDIDRLQVVNESLGRSAGDHVIKSVGEMLRHKLRGTDSVSYLGEGRYGVLLESCGIEQGMQVSQTLREQVKEGGLSWDGMVLDLSVSIGITVVEPHIHKIEQVMEAAELAREAAKELGNGQLQVFRQNDQDLVMRKHNMQYATTIQKALRENRFRLYCQTIRPVAESREEYHFEVLLRLIGEDGAVMSPVAFLQPAEQYNLMPAIDRWVIDATFSALATAGIAGKPGQGTVSINLSGQSLTDVALADYIRDKLHQYGLAPDCICFEVTETAAIGNKTAALRIIEQLKKLGCHFSLDDFGTGLSTFSYLKELPVDYVKIDGSFVRKILEDKVSHAMVASINQIGHVMGLRTVAEFVESEALAERLALMGLDYLQGYAIDEPQPLTDYLSGLAGARSVRAG